MLLDTELRQIFLGEVAAYLEILEDPGASAEAQGDAAHGLKGAAGMLGFSELQDLAGRIEGALRRGESGPRDEHLPKLRAIARSLAEEDGSAPAGSSGSPQVAEPCTRLDENAASEPPATFPAASPTEPPLEPIEEPLAEPLDPGPDARAACVGQTPPAEDLDPREAAFAAEFDAETAAMLRTFFAEEAAEHLAEMERALALLEERPTDSELVGALFRASHTLKGAAATVGLGRISEAAHRLEDRFEEIRDRGEPATPARLSSLVRATDLLRAMVDARDTSSHRRILDEIRELVAASSGAAAQSAPSRHEPPATAPPPSTLEPIVDAPSSGDWDADTQRILQETFAAEARELLDQIDPLVETLSAGGRDASDLDLLFRLIHTLKGSSAAVGMPGIPEAAHILEDHVSLVRDKRPIPPPGPDLLAVLATLHDLVDAALQGLPTGPLLEAFRGAMMGRRLSLPAPPQGRPLQASRPSRAPTPMPTPALASLTVPEEVSGELERRGRPDRRAQDRRQDEDRLIRVNAEHFDALLSHVGEIVFRRTLIERRSEELTGLVRDLGRSHHGFRSALANLRNLKGAEPHLQRFSELEVEFADELSNFERAEAGLREETEGLRRDAAHLQDGLTQIRLLSVRYLFARLRRAVRDIAHTEGKQVQLVTEGEETEIDRIVAEKLADPMIQLIRNAVAHGIEPPESRRALGKPDAGIIVIRANQEGNFVTLEVRDDGAGIDVASVREALVSRGVMNTEEAMEAPEEEITAAIFLPGLSTRRSADEVAGRGVGLDVVRDTITKLGGEVSVVSIRKKGTRFAVRMPLSTAVTNALLFKTGGEVYCIPVRSVVETRYVKHEEIEAHRGRRTVLLRGKRLPLLDLSTILQVEPRRQGKFLATLVLRHLEFDFALIVDRIVGPREVVLRKLGPLLDPLDLYSAATISGAAKVQLVLDVATLHRWASAWRTLPTARRPQAIASGRLAAQRPRILVCDDSRSIQLVVSRILTEEGFSVELASDGWDAWERMNALRVDLLLTDLEMPRMDGYALVEKCRRDERLRALPILVLSSRTGEENQRRAAAAGSDGFLHKPVNRRVIVSRIKEILASPPRRA